MSSSIRTSIARQRGSSGVLPRGARVTVEDIERADVGSVPHIVVRQSGGIYAAWPASVDPVSCRLAWLQVVAASHRQRELFQGGA